ncbi:MAG: hypothetical protein ACOX52_16640 [Verrucomicrobiota bacterium]
MRARCQPEHESIPISISIATMIGRIGNPSYPYSYSRHHRVRERVPLRCVRVRFWAELEIGRKGQSQSKIGLAIKRRRDRIRT